MDPVLSALLSALDRGGPFVVAIVFAMIWWLERKDRKDAQIDEREASRRATEGLNNAANAIGDIRVFLGLERERRGNQP